MRRLNAYLATALLAVGLTIGWIALNPSVARAEDPVSSRWQITSYDVTAVAERDGTTNVTLLLDFDFSSDAGRGIFLTLPTRMSIPDNPDQWRVLPTEVTSVTSPTGAPVDLEETTSNGVLSVRIGNPDITVNGVQRYLVKYTIRGIVEPNAGQGLDEVNWNVVGTAWEVPISNVTVRVQAPAEATKTACFTGPAYDRPCDTQPTPGASVEYRTDRLPVGSGMQVVAGYPAGTFVGAEPTFSKRFSLSNMFPATPGTLGATGALTVLGLFGVGALVWRHGRDQAYLNTTPGVLPLEGSATPVGSVGRHEIAVRFSPPDGARPGEIGVLVDAVAEEKDVTATILDLAVRGHLTLERTGDKDYTFHRVTDAARLAGYEQTVFTKLFHSEDSTSTKELARKGAAELFPASRDALYRRVSGELGWFRMPPQQARIAARVVGGVLVVLGIGVGLLAGLAGYGLIGLSLVIVGITLALLAGRMPARTPVGSAMLAQAKGFELYLSSAEADQLRFEEGEDIFSKYLPWAVIFGVADRWVKLFEGLAAQGRYDMSPVWYVGHGYSMHFGMAGYGFAASMTSSMAASADAARSAASSSSAGGFGGSGFSGGGGFGGGGGGGW